MSAVHGLSEGDYMGRAYRRLEWKQIGIIARGIDRRDWKRMGGGPLRKGILPAMGNH